MTTVLHTPHGSIELPVFLPDATAGVVRTVDAADLTQGHIDALMMNTFHLMQRPGSSTIQALGGLHAMSGWQRPIITDSGGFQAYSLIRQNAKYGQLSRKGLTFQPDGADRKFHLTPEKTVQLQLSYGADVVFCLDDCTHIDDSHDVQEESVKRTIAWAKRGKSEFDRLLDQKRMADRERPLFFAIIQGGGIRELRQQCAEELVTIGCDGFGFGGWPLDRQGNLLVEIVAYVRELIPQIFPLHALGVGHPKSIAECVRIGYNLFDSSLPTRDARHGRLYMLSVDSADFSLLGDKFAYLYIQDKKHIKVNRPISETCDCHCCQQYTVGYLHHLFKLQDGLYQRLATIHNLRFMSRLMAYLRDETH